MLALMLSGALLSTSVAYAQDGLGEDSYTEQGEAGPPGSEEDPGGESISEEENDSFNDEGNAGGEEAGSKDEENGSGESAPETSSDNKTETGSGTSSDNKTEAGSGTSSDNKTETGSETSSDNKTETSSGTSSDNGTEAGSKNDSEKSDAVEAVGKTENVSGSEGSGIYETSQSKVPETEEKQQPENEQTEENQSNDEKKTHEDLSQITFDDHDGHEMDIEYDEHIWTSPANAMKLVEVITEILKEVSPENAPYFEENKNSYEKELKELDDEFKDIVSNGRHRMIVVADKFPFRYFAQEYGLSYRAAFSGCSTDTEPSAKTIAYLIDRIREKQIQAVFYLELSSHRTADIISEETGAKPLLLHSCHNVTRRQFDEGVTYLQLMKQNAKNLREALL